MVAKCYILSLHYTLSNTQLLMATRLKKEQILAQTVEVLQVLADVGVYY